VRGDRSVVASTDISGDGSIVASTVASGGASAAESAELAGLYDGTPEEPRVLMDEQLRRVRESHACGPGAAEGAIRASNAATVHLGVEEHHAEGGAAEAAAMRNTASDVELGVVASLVERALRAAVASEPAQLDLIDFGADEEVPGGGGDAGFEATTPMRGVCESDPSSLFPAPMHAIVSPDATLGWFAAQSCLM
jgi:hypothetical protein